MKKKEILCTALVLGVIAIPFPTISGLEIVLDHRFMIRELFHSDVGMIFFEYEVGPDKKIFWSFNGSNPEVSIDVYVVNNSTFATSTLMSDWISVSSGTYIDEGYFTPPYGEIWLFLFCHFDDDHKNDSSVVFYELFLIRVQEETTTSPETPTTTTEPPTTPTKPKTTTGEPRKPLKGWQLGLIIVGSFVALVLILGVLGSFMKGNQEYIEPKRKRRKRK